MKKKSIFDIKTRNRAGMTVHLLLFLTSALRAHYFSTSYPDPIMPKETCSSHWMGTGWAPWLPWTHLEETLYPSRVSEPASWSLYVAWSLLTILFQIPNTDRRTSKWIYAKYGLQLGTTLDKLNTGYGCSLWALYKHSSQHAQWHGNFQVTIKNWTKFWLQQCLPCGHHPWPFRL